MTSTHYIVPFRSLLRQVGLDDQSATPDVVLAQDQLRQLIKLLLRSVPIDEVWYRNAYPDVDLAIREGQIESVRDHFVESGYFEGRKPGKVVVDESWYLSKYPDVAEGVEFGEIASAQDHYESHGEREGRMPFSF